MSTWTPKGRNRTCKRCGKPSLWYMHPHGYLCRECWTAASLLIPSDAERAIDAACLPAQWRKTASVATRWDLGACPRCHGAVLTQLGPEPDLLERSCLNCGALTIQPVAA